jgi:hypothetical protein
MSSLFSRLSAMILVLTFASVTACSAGDRANRTLPPPAVDAPMVSTNGQQTAVIAGGCFWGIQAVFQHTEGVISATSGYTPEAQRRLQNANWSAPARPVMRSRDGYVRSIQNHIWPTASCFLLGGPRPHAVEPAGRLGTSVGECHILVSTELALCDVRFNCLCCMYQAVALCDFSSQSFRIEPKLLSRQNRSNRAGKRSCRHQ